MARRKNLNFNPCYIVFSMGPVQTGKNAKMWLCVVTDEDGMPWVLRRTSMPVGPDTFGEVCVLQTTLNADVTAELNDHPSIQKALGLIN